MSALLRLRSASPGALWLSAAMALVAAGVLDRIDPRASFLTGMLFGMAVGLAIVASLAAQRRHASR